jgi:hypothetical protein
MKTYITLPASQLFFKNLPSAFNRNDNFSGNHFFANITKHCSLNTIAVVILGSLLLTGCKKDNVEINRTATPVKMENIAVTTNSLAGAAGSPLDGLDIVDAPFTNGTLYGNIDSTGFYNFTQIARDLISAAATRIVLNNNQLTVIGPSLAFVKAGVLPSTKKPFYYLKVASKYMYITLGGILLTDPGQNDIYREFVFTKGPQITGAPGPTYYIHSVGMSAVYDCTLQVWYDGATREYAIGFRFSNQTNIRIKQQVFAIKSPLSLPPNIN